jgi:hypothetical protein
MANALVVGDVLELTLPGGVAYVTYAGRNESLGDAIWIVPKIFVTPREDWKMVFSEEGYFAFYPANAAVRRKLVRKVGFSAEAMRLLPRRRRSEADSDDQGNVTSWLIIEGKERVVRPDTDLDETERELPIASSWNHEYLMPLQPAGSHSEHYKAIRH